MNNLENKIENIMVGTILVFREHTTKEKYFKITNIFLGQGGGSGIEKSVFESAYDLNFNWIKSNHTCPLKNWFEHCDIYSQPENFYKFDIGTNLYVKENILFQSKFNNKYFEVNFKNPSGVFMLPRITKIKKRHETLLLLYPKMSKNLYEINDLVTDINESYILEYYDTEQNCDYDGLFPQEKINIQRFSKIIGD